MFDGRADTDLGLHTAHIGGSHFARDERIFRIILVVASAQQVAVDVHGRSQQQCDTELDQFFRHSCADFLQQGGIPALRQQHFYGPRGGVAVDVLSLAAAHPLGKLLHQPPVVTLKHLGGLDAAVGGDDNFLHNVDTGRTVTEHNVRHTLLLQRDGGLAARACNLMLTWGLVQ